MRTLLFTVLISCSAAFAQPQWQALPNIPAAGVGRFDDVFFISPTLGWAVSGNGATVYKTTDGGASWVVQLTEFELGSNNFYFRNIEFLNENIGFVGTLNGIFLKTIDGGENWTQVSNISPNPPAICGLDAVGESTIYGCGAYFSPAFLIKSTDSGATWQYIDMSAYANALVEVLFVDENVGYASGRKLFDGGVILKTTDGGATWTQIYVTNQAGEYVWKLQILQGNPNVMFGSVESVSPMLGKLIISSDGGDSWISKVVPDTHIQAVGFMTENHGWMGGHNSLFLETFDAGTTWNDIGTGSNLNRIFIIDQNLAYASGTTIYKYSDATMATGDFTEAARTPLAAVIHPNPVVDELQITIDFPDGGDHLVIELYDATGRMIKELQNDDIAIAGKKTYKFDFEYAAGIYLVNLLSNSGRQSIKFVK